MRALLPDYYASDANHLNHKRYDTHRFQRNDGLTWLSVNLRFLSKKIMQVKTGQRY